jgi:DedD protein
MAESQDVNLLRRRGRRRLVGAIALVLIAAIVLPMVFDPEPMPGAPPVSVRIPGEDESTFSPKVGPRLEPAPPAAGAAPQGAPVSAPAAETPKIAAKAVEKPPAITAPAPAPQAAPPPRADGVAGAEQFVIPVAALATQAKVNELAGKLKAARLPYYTEPLATAKGTVTRVRVGPYATREAAEDAHRQLLRLGLKPGNVVARS